MGLNVNPLWISYLILGIPALLIGLTLKVTGHQSLALGAGALGALIAVGIVWKIMTGGPNQDPTTDSEAI